MAQQIPGKACSNCGSKTSGLNSVMNGTASINTSYTMSACGLNFTQATVPLNQRPVYSMLAPVGNPQPATFSISGIPPCNTILKAFLYVCTVGSGTTINASVTNPATTSSVFPMTKIGTDVSVCWMTVGTDAYRADVTSIISGNGNYVISGIPTSSNLATDDAEGATLFIIYADNTQSYTGNIVLADGCRVWASASLTPITSTIGGFSVCGTPTLTSHFMLVGDLQGFDNTYYSFNASGVPNYTKSAASDQVWDYITAPGNAFVAGQTSCVFGIDPTPGLDCVALVMAGSYYRTSCLTCPAPGLTLTATSPSCSGSASVAVIGGTAPYTYTWSGTAQTTSVVSGLAPGTYTVRVKDANNCNTASLTVNVTAPASVTVSGTQTTCVGFSVALSASGPVSGYTWSPSAFLNGSNTATVIATPLASTVFTVAVTNSLGCVATRTAEVIVTQTQTISAVSSTICAGQTLTFSAGASSGAVYMWNGPNNFVSSLSAMSIPNAGVPQSGIYTITIITVPGCTLTGTRAALVNPSPTQTLSTNAPFCAGNTLSVSALNTSQSYLWSGPNGFTSSAQSFSLANAVIPSAGVYSLVTTNTIGCTNTSTIAVVIYTNPVAGIGTFTNVCEGSIHVFAGTGGGSYQWSGPNGYTSAAQNATILVQPANAGIYQLTVTSTAGCLGSTTATLIVLLKPAISASGATLCAGNTATLQASGLAFFTWTGPNNFSNISQNIVIPVSALTAGSYTVVGTSLSNTCTNSAIVNMVALPQPTLSATGTVVCVGSTATLTSNGAVSYSWSGPQSYTSLLQSALVPIANGLSSGAYTVTGFAINSCSNTAVANLATMPLPVFSATNVSVCEGEPGLLVANGSAVSYSWAGPGNYSAFGVPVIIPVVNLFNSGVYTVTGMAANTCTASTTLTLQVLQLPALSASGVTVCYGNSATLNVSGAQTYIWSGPPGISTGPVLQVPVVDNTTAGNYTVIGTGVNTCSMSSVVVLSALPLPVVSATGATVCIGKPAVLNAGGGASYLWTGPNGYSSLSALAFIAVAGSITPQVYTVVVMATNSCTANGTAILQTLPLPQISITTSNSLICMGENVTLNASGAQSYSWTAIGNQNPLIVSPVVTTDYFVEGTSLDNCTNTKSVTITVDRCAGMASRAINSNRIFIYPNPSNSFFTISSDEKISLHLVNCLGQLLRQIELREENNFQLIVDELPKGVYYITSVYANGIESQKIIIE